MPSMPPIDSAKMNADLIEMFKKHDKEAKDPDYFGLNDDNKVIFKGAPVANAKPDMETLKLHVYLAGQGVKAEDLRERKISLSDVQTQLKLNMKNEEKKSKGLLQRWLGWGGNDSSNTGNAHPLADKVGEGMAAGQRMASNEGKGERQKKPFPKRTPPPPPERESSLPGSPDSARSGRGDISLTPHEKEQLKALRAEYDQKLNDFRRKEKDANELFGRIVKLKGSSKKQDNMAMTFAATRGAVNVNNGLNSSDSELSNKATICVNVYADEKQNILNVVKDYSPVRENSGELAGQLLSGVRKRLESQMYESGSRKWGSVKDTDKDALVKLFNFEGSKTKKEEEASKLPDFEQRQRRAEFEQNIWTFCVFDEKGELDIDKTVLKMRRSLPNGSLKEPMLGKLKDWVVSVERKKNAAHGSRFLKLKQGVLSNMGVYDLPALVSQMTRSEFKKFQDLYVEKITSGELGKISKKHLIESVVKEEMENFPSGPTQPQDAAEKYDNYKSMAQQSLENYARAFVEKAMTTLSDTPHIPDEKMNDFGIIYESVKGEKDDSWGLKHKTEDKWVKWNGDTFEECSREESEESYKRNKHLLCCFDESIFAPLEASAPTPQAEKAGDGNKSKEEVEAWEVKVNMGIILDKEKKMEFSDIKSMIEDKQKDLDRAQKEVEKYIEKARDELSRRAGNKLTEGNSAITDLSDPNRPDKLKEAWANCYDDLNTNAVEALEPFFPEDSDSIAGMRITSKIVSHCYEIVRDFVDEEKNSFSDALYEATQTRLHEERYCELRNNLKSLKGNCIEKKTELIAEQLVDSVCKRLGTSKYNPLGEADLPKPGELDPATWKNGAKGKEWLDKYDDEQTKDIMTAKVYTRNFVKEVCKIIYKMCSQEPPIILKWKPEGEALDGDDLRQWKGYMKKARLGAKVDFVAWPALYLPSNDGTLAVLDQGIMQPK